MVDDKLKTTVVEKPIAAAPDVKEAPLPEELGKVIKSVTAADIDSQGNLVGAGSLLRQEVIVNGVTEYRLWKQV